MKFIYTDQELEEMRLIDEVINAEHAEAIAAMDEIRADLERQEMAADFDDEFAVTVDDYALGEWPMKRIAQEYTAAAQEKAAS